MITISPRLLKKDQGMNAEQIKTVEKEIGYKFKDKQLLIQAYTRRSFSNENDGELHNEVLETIGDAVLSHCVLQRFLKEYGTRTEKGMSIKKNEGEFTKLKHKLVQGISLANTVSEKNLANHEYFRLGEGDKSAQVCKNQSVQADLLESIIGAVAADCNFDNETLCRVSSRLTDLKKYIETDFAGTPRDHISELQEYCQRYGLKTPDYVYKPDEGGEWICSLNFEDELFEKTGHNQKEAKRNVAQAVLEKIETKPIERKIGLPYAKSEQNPINKLQELHQKGRIPLARYEYSGSAEHGWSCSASFEGFEKCDAAAANKSSAKMQAAEKLYKIVKRVM